MKCSELQEKFVEYLTGEIDEKSRAEIQAHIAGCEDCREELESLSALWAKLGVLPKEQPGPGLRTRFYSMLEAYKEGMATEEPHRSIPSRISGWLEGILPKKPVHQFALSLAMLAVGIAGGILLTAGRQGASPEIAQLRREVRDMNQMVAVSLLEQPSPSDRLKGVSWSAKLDQPDDKTLQALLRTLDTDPNVNIRLAAADALYIFYKHPLVKEGLVRSLSNQTSPLVQIALIDLLVEIRERRAAEALKQLIGSEKLNPDVKKRAEQGLAQLI
jgi:hypothetical protein